LCSFTRQLGGHGRSGDFVLGAIKTGLLGKIAANAITNAAITNIIAAAIFFMVEEIIPTGLDVHKKKRSADPPKGPRPCASRFTNLLSTQK
jgi:hypothetical protein